jgi:glycosyltransferase involved in cell wall biosynthesis
MTLPLISCIVPVFNGERYLREALDSIRAQTYQPLEIIVADDGSTDGSRAVVVSYSEEVRLLRQSTSGPAATRNLGLSAAQGPFVAFLDQDDLWHPEKLARQMSRFQARPELDLCVAHVRNFWIPELIQEELQYRDHPRAQAMPGYYTGTLLARRTLFDRVGRFNTAFRHGDATEWFLRAAEHGAVMELLSGVLTYHRMHHCNLSRREASASRDEYLHIVKGSLDRRRLRNEAVPWSTEFSGSGWQQKR